MRYVRMLTNALLGGLLGAAFVTILVLQLNRQIPLSWSTAGPLYGRLALFYAPHLTVLLYAMLIAREALARRPLSPGWLSIRILSWVGLLVVAAAAALMWANFVGYELALDDDSRRRLGAAAGATTLCAVLLLVIAIVHYSFGRRGSRVGATLLTLTLLASVGFPLTARGWGDPRPLAARAIDLSPLAGAGLDGGHVTILAVDGASLDYIAQRVADGRLPAFGRLLEGGVSLYLETVRPTQPAPVWTSVADRQIPAADRRPRRRPLRLRRARRRHRAAARLLLLAGARPLRPAAGGRLPVERGAGAAAVDDPQQPARVGRRRRLAGERAGRAAARLPDHRRVRAGRRVARARRRIDGVRRAGRGRAARDRGGRRTARRCTPVRSRIRRWRAMPGAARSPCSCATSTGRGCSRCATKGSIAPGICTCSTRGRARSAAAARTARRGWRRSSIGTTRSSTPRSRTPLDTMGPDDVLLVVSGFGMEPVGLGKRLLARVLGQPDVPGSHEDAPDGFLLAYGAPMRSGRARLGSIVDVAPTVLYLLGLPVARDMDGIARTDLFKPAFTATRPIAFIPTYER